jgi:5-guanidino-2-oxopentanoate decarboxylase
VAERTCGEALVELLTRYGVDTVFGIPGVHNLEIYRGIAGSGVRHVLARNEQGAGFMADGYARAGGGVGVCTVITGPGVTNAATPMGQAYADSIPVLFLSSENPSHTLRKGWGCLHEITDQRAVTAPLTGLSATAMSPDELPDLIGQAFSLFAAGRPRPVHIAIPLDVLATPTRADWVPRTPPTRAQPEAAALRRAAQLLADAKRPAMLLGGGAVEATGFATELAEWLDAAVLCSSAGKGIVPDSHPLNLGVSLAFPAVQNFLARADVVLAVGTELAEPDSDIERLPIEGRLIRIDIDPAKINDLYPAHLGIHADAGPALAGLLAAVKEIAAERTGEDTRAALAALRGEIDAQLTPPERAHGVVLAALREALPEDGIVFADATQLAYTGSFAYPVERPRSWHYTAGYCALGSALPSAVGALVADAARPTVALAGDYGLQFTIQELATAVELGVSLPIVVWNNRGLQQMRDDMDLRDIPRVGVDLHNPDFAALAGAYGARAAQPQTLDAFTSALAQGLRAGVPTLIEVEADANWLHQA